MTEIVLRKAISEAVKHLAHWQGASIGCNAAKAFVLGRNIMRLNIDNKNCPQDEN
jgi:hypothetical protein